jgi:hypothetical protein
MREKYFNSSVVYKRLICCIFFQAAKDWQDSKRQSEISEFFQSPWADTIAEYCDLDRDSLRVKLESGAICVNELRGTYAGHWQFDDF